MNDALFADTGLEVNFSAASPFRRIFLADAKAIAWDGASEATNAAIESAVYPGCYCYAEVRITGRRAMAHRGGIWGIKARVRFTSPDDSGEWFDAIVRPVPGRVAA